MLRIILFLSNKRYFLFLFCVSILLFSCEKQEEANGNISKSLVAKVGNSILYEGDLEDVLAEAKGEDSIALRKRFINNWIRKEILLNTAKMNLTEEEQDVEDRVKDYRASLLINLYKQKYLLKHLDTLVTSQDVAIYLKEYSDHFILQEPLYRYYWAKILKKNKEDVWFVASLFEKSEIDLMQDFDLKSSTVIGVFDLDWYRGEELLEKLPKGAMLKGLRKGKVATFQDEEAFYFLKPIEIVQEGELSPQEYVQDKIKAIILHDRKIKLAKRLEYEIYEDAKEKQQFEVY